MILIINGMSGIRSFYLISIYNRQALDIMEENLMKKRRLILACVLILFCTSVLIACNSQDESINESIDDSIDENLIGQWGTEYGPAYSFFENGQYERYPDKRVNGRYTIRKDEITLEPPLRFSDLYKEVVYTYSIVEDTLILTTKDGATYSYIRLK